MEGGTDNTFGAQVVIELYSKSSRCFSWVPIVSGHFVAHSKTWVRSDNHSVTLITVFTLEQQATYEGYACRKLKVSNTGIVSSLSTNQQTQSHYVVIQSKDKLLTSGTKREHCCGSSDKARLEVTKRVHEANKRTREEYICISTLYNDAMGGLYDKGYDFEAEMLRSQSLKRFPRQNRYKSQGSTKEKSRENVTYGEELLRRMTDGSSFFTADNRQTIELPSLRVKRRFKTILPAQSLHKVWWEFVI